MADTVFHRLHRIRKLSEQRARMDKLQAAVARDREEAVVLSIEERTRTSRDLFADSTAGAISHHHTYAVHNEMQRRGAAARLWEADEDLARASGVFRQRAVAARSVELLAEAWEDRIAEEERVHEQHELDEVGTQRWMRRAS